MGCDMCDTCKRRLDMGLDTGNNVRRILTKQLPMGCDTCDTCKMRLDMGLDTGNNVRMGCDTCDTCKRRLWRRIVLSGPGLRRKIEYLGSRLGLGLG
eukprot:895854-Amorphochlora_amoeboformis.AAC.1